MDFDEKARLVESLLWAKKEPYKSLLVHMAESGAVARVLLLDSCFRPVLSLLCKLTGLDEVRVVSLVSYFVSLHDIGKIHPAFVQQFSGEVKQKLEGLDLSVLDKPFRHEVYGESVLYSIWEHSGKFSQDRVYALVSCVAGLHHQGKSRENFRLGGERKKVFSAVQEAYEKKMYGLFKPDLCFTVSNMDAFCYCLLGVMVMSDWIASGDDFSGMPAETFVEAVFASACEKARRFVAKNNLGHNVAFSGISSFTELWDFIPRENMRPLQSEMECLLKDTKEVPSAIVIEAPMGEGKTEAALYAASRLARAWGKEGVYVALPTAATSNQMYGRVNAMLARLGLSRSKLMHAMAWIIEDTANRMFCSDDREEALLWTASKRKGLLSPYAVGTVDQAMLAVMPARYSVLRGLGLSQKVLVIDELHSYDAYMNVILLTLLKWCVVLDIPVIMLSATLPSVTKEMFAGCYTGEKVSFGSMYPSVTLFYNGKAPKQVPVASCYEGKEVYVESAPWMHDTVSLCKFLSGRLLQTGGCYCVIRNTVKEAQQTYLELKKLLPEGSVMLFHSRFPAGRRAEIEQRCISCFGKDAGPARPKSMVIVATQVLEQSLDVDFDFMVSDLCPVDLLLQRLGRLFRHLGTLRPEGMRPVLMVLLPEGNNYGASGVVYPEILLCRTASLLEKKSRIVFPADIPAMVEKVYASGLSAGENMEWWSEYNDQKNMKEGVARIRVIGSPSVSSFCLFKNPDLYSDEEGQRGSVKTRLGEQSLRMAVLPGELFGKAVGVDVPASVAKEVMLHSFSVPGRAVCFLAGLDLDRDAGSAAGIVEGRGLLRGTLLLKAGDDGSFVYGSHVIVVDDELGVLVKEVADGV